jgi:hypothetical protein
MEKNFKGLLLKMSSVSISLSILFIYMLVMCVATRHIFFLCQAEFKGVRIYGSDVMALAFTADDNSLVSCGGADAGLVQWEITDD